MPILQSVITGLLILAGFGILAFSLFETNNIIQSMADALIVTDANH